MLRLPLLWLALSLMLTACVSHGPSGHRELVLAPQTSPAGIAAEGDLLGAAKEARFDYMAHLRRAEAGDAAALLALIELTPRISWSAAGYEEQGEVLLALHARLGADAFREVLLGASPEARSQVITAMYAMSGNQRPLHLTDSSTSACLEMAR